MMNVTRTPAVSAVVIGGEEEIYFNKGYADIDNEIKVSSETQFELGSTTKAFSALGFLLLEQEYLVNRQEYVSQYIPWFKPTYKGEQIEITLEEILCHTSGIPDWTIATIPEGTESTLLEETVRNISGIELNSMPGTSHHYATINYDILALVIEEITGEKFEDYITKNVLQPLEMKDSYFKVDYSKTAQYAQGYKYQFGVVAPYDAPVYYGNTAAGYLVSTTKDLSRWLKAQMGMLDIPENLKVAIETSHSYNISPEQNYWAGWMINEDYIAHGGNNPNFSSQVIIDIENKKAVFVLTNLFSSSVNSIADGVFRMMRGDTVEIGLFIDPIELLDWIAGLICLIAILILVALIGSKSKKIKFPLIKIIIGIVAIIGLVMLPYLFKYNYSSLMVWYSPFLFVAIGMVVLCISCYLYKCLQGKLQRNTNCKI